MDAMYCLGENFLETRFEIPTHEEIVLNLQIMLFVEGIYGNQTDISKVVDHFRGDVRRAMNELQMWASRDNIVSNALLSGTEYVSSASFHRTYIPVDEQSNTRPKDFCKEQLGETPWFKRKVAVFKQLFFDLVSGYTPFRIQKDSMNSTDPICLDSLLKRVVCPASRLRVPGIEDTLRNGFEIFCDVSLEALDSIGILQLDQLSNVTDTFSEFENVHCKPCGESFFFNSFFVPPSTNCIEHSLDTIEEMALYADGLAMWCATKTGLSVSKKRPMLLMNGSVDNNLRRNREQIKNTLASNIWPCSITVDRPVEDIFFIFEACVHN